MNENDLAEWRRRLDLAILRGKDLIVSRDEMAALLDALEECGDALDQDLDYDHHLDDCDRCDEMNESLESAQDELKDAEKRAAELEDENAKLEERLENLKQEFKDMVDQL